MIPRKQKPCKCGKHLGYLFSHGYTKECWNKVRPPKALKRTAIKQAVRKPSGELILFKAIFASRPHKCQVTGDPITEFNVSNFMHILSKGAFPKFRLFDKNILFVTKEIHDEYDCKDRSAEKFKDVMKLHDELITKYYQKEKV